MMSEIYLGFCDYTPAVQSAHTRIDCKAVAVGARWKKRNLEQVLSPSGKAFAISLPWALEHQPIAACVLPNPRLIDMKKDHFIVDRSFPVRQVIDFREKGREEARRVLLETGIPELTRGTIEIVAAISDTECVVASMQPHPARDCFVANPGNFTVFSFTNELFDGDDFGGRFFEVPGATVGQEIGTLNWQMDRDFLESILKRLAKNLSDGPNRTERERIISLLHRAQEDSENMPDWQEMQAWLSSYLPRIEKNLRIPVELLDLLASTPAAVAHAESLEERVRIEVEAKLEPVVRIDLEKRYAEAMALAETAEALAIEVQAANKKAEERLESTNSRADEAMARLEASLLAVKDTLSKDIDTLNATKRVLSETLQTEISAVNLELGQMAIDDADNLKEIVRRLRRALGENSGLVNPTDLRVPPWAAPFTIAASCETISSSDLPKQLSRIGIATGLPIDEVRLFDMSLRGGALTVIPQGPAMMVFEAYAGAITGGRLHRETVGPTVLSIDDLWVRPGTGAPTAFATAWRGASADPMSWQLVWLEGLHRSPVDLWLPSLTELLRHPSRPENLMVGASTEASFVDIDRRWQDASDSCVPIQMTGGSPSRAGLARRVAGQDVKLYKLAFETATLPKVASLEEMVANIPDGVPETRLHVEAFLCRGALSIHDEELKAQEAIHRLEGLRRAGVAWLDKVMGRKGGGTRQ
jgi:hypothetical protein